jgi:hypothetical protein
VTRYELKALSRILHDFIRLMTPFIKSRMLKDWSTKTVPIENGIAKAITGSKQFIACVGIAAQ